MIKDGIGTPEQLDQARTAYEVAKSRLAALAKQSTRSARRSSSRDRTPSR